MKKQLLSLLMASTMLLSFSKTTFAEPIPEPQIVGKYAITVDASTGEVIYAKDPDARVYPASVTKVMTAILVEKLFKMDDMVTYTQTAKIQDPSSINMDIVDIPIGQQIPVSAALKAMMLYSANDMTELVATNYPTKGSDSNKEFVALMNSEAKVLGMNSTNFVTTNGLDDNTNEHLTTAYDLSIMAREAAKYPNIRAVWQLPNPTNIDFPGLTSVQVGNPNKFLQQGTDFYDPSCVGVKSGFTDKAGRCLLSVFERNGRQIVGIVLNCETSYLNQTIYTDMKNIINYSYQAQRSLLTTTEPATGKVTSYSKDSLLTTIPVEYKEYITWGKTKTIDVPLYLAEDASIYSNAFNLSSLNVKYNYDIDLFKDDEKNIIGTVTIQERERTTNIPIYTNINSSVMKTLTKTVLPSLSKSTSNSIYIYTAVASLSVAVITLGVIVHRNRKVKRNTKNKSL